MIPVPFWLAVVLVVIGAVFWIAEQPKKARQRREAREARDRLRADLADPPPAARLPYGMTGEPDDPGASGDSAPGVPGAPAR